MSAKKISVIVPVYNLESHFRHLETELSKLDRAAVEIILVNDGSTDETGRFLVDLRTVWDEILVIECEENRGAGAARNLGFSRATGEYTLFFDADDFLHPENIWHTIDLLDASRADASMNVYDFIREGDRITTGMNAFDHQLWKAVYPRFHGKTFAIDACPELLRFTNFPWNKVIRTSYYKQLRLRPFFGETRVNNDVHGHWNTLLHARKLLLVDEKIVTHRIYQNENHISKQFGAERLEMFDALQLLRSLTIAGSAERKWLGREYWLFARKLVEWGESHMDKRFRADFRCRLKALARLASIADLRDLVEAGEGDTCTWILESLG